MSDNGDKTQFDLFVVATAPDVSQEDKLEAGMKFVENITGPYSKMELLEVAGDSRFPDEVREEAMKRASILVLEIPDEVGYLEKVLEIIRGPTIARYGCDDDNLKRDEIIRSLPTDDIERLRSRDQNTWISIEIKGVEHHIHCSGKEIFLHESNAPESVRKMAKELYARILVATNNLKGWNQLSRVAAFRDFIAKIAAEKVDVLRREGILPDRGEGAERVLAVIQGNGGAGTGTDGRRASTRLPAGGPTAGT